ncbi:MAG: DUF1549 domain-containing protein [Pirellulales bacterium]
MTDGPRHNEHVPPDDERDPVLDAFLDEALGGATPPDVSARVLSALGGTNGAANGTPIPPPVPASAMNGAHAHAARPHSPSPHSARPLNSRRRRGRWTEWTIAAGVVAGCALAVWIALGPGGMMKPGSVQPSVAGPNEPEDGGRTPGNVKLPDNSAIAKTLRGDNSPPHQDAGPSPGDAQTDVAPRAPEPSTVADTGPRSALPNEIELSPPDRTPRDQIPPRPAVRSSDAEVIAAIDLAIRQRWAAATVTPSMRATDAEWLRRTFLSVLGRIPKLAEVESFLADASSNKRAAAVDRLLTSDVYAEEFARNWTNVYTEALLGHTVGDMPSDKTDRGGLRQYLRRSFLENKPYDVLTTELLTATGSTRPGDRDFNGATNFLADRLDNSGVQATVKTAEVFLGVQVQCTQCHNHPFNDWKQGRFWELNAFFRQSKAIGNDAAKLVDTDFYGEGTASDDDAEIYYEERNGRLKAAYPVFFDGTAISRNGEVNQVNRRRELARLVTASPWFAEAAVNRMWSHFFGHGFTRPIDDMGPHNAPTHPELLDRLAREFAARDYDLKSLIRWIALSEPYALSSRPSRDNQHDDPTAGDPPLFSRYYLRQMQAEQLYESLAATTGEMNPARGSDGDPDAANRGDETLDEVYAQREREKADWMRQFVIAYRTDECDECSLFVGSIPQTLAMMNGELVADATSSQSTGLLSEIARSPISEAKKVRQLFLAALARNPSPGEQTAARRLLSMHGNDTAAGLEDLWWALLNSNEFILDR